MANVTARYDKWWKTSVSSSKCRDPKLVGTVEVPSGFIPTLLIPSVAPSSLSPKQNTLTPLISVVEDCNHVLEDGDNIVDDVPSGSIPRLLIIMPFENSGFIPSVAPSSSPPKQNTLTPLVSFKRKKTPLVSVVEDCNHVLEDVQFKDAYEIIEARLSSDRILDDGSKPSRGYNIVDNVPSGFMLSDNSVEDVEFKDDANENQEAMLNM
ncbi:hypothetical protein L195_g008827 [Trifolium pratense]|uniref:Uncharacterized protein n=1 Tax=Trifolium pratense TaxID=57577 RepID=A0A2K3N1P7_TRIPR|nr:hypothetical protein L195_g042249 [Trifolium pratense]PNX96968.1 hypothetical protein L195_g020186 [Trifolium pratense]PNY12201.1 hypothetical protein L195_g008827 [Trifolium pratense]